MQRLFAIDAMTMEPVEVRFENGITGVDPLLGRVEGKLPLVGAGWIDLQVNGFAGADYCDPHCPQEDIARSLDVQLSTGVTRILATIITNSEENLIGALRNLADAKETLPNGEVIEAIHVEGPYISPEDGPRGAHPKEHVRKPDVDEFKRWQEAARGYIRLVTLSPEWDEAPAYIQALVREGIVVSIGHTKATGEQIRAAVDAGATKSTHLGNGAHFVLPRHPNYIWEQMADDRLAAGFICDGFHLSPTFVKCAIRAKGLERSLLVTDAVAPAECAPGQYKLGVVDVQLLPEGRVVLMDGSRLAGSALRMDRAVGNTVKMTGLGLPEVLPMASRTPARVARIAGRQRGIAVGDRADFVVFDWDAAACRVNVRETWVSGRQVYGH